MVEHEWCGNDTVLNFCSRYLVEEAELNNATFDAANSVKIHDQTLLWFYGIVFVVGFICNIIVIIGMLTDYSSMVTCSHIYALHMAIADLILLCLLPFQIVEIKNNETWFFGLIFCKIYRTIKVMNFLVSISFLTLMSIDRYKAISGSSYKPVRQRRRPPKSAHAIAAAVWIFAFSLSIPVLTRSTTHKGDDGDQCYELWIDGTDVETITFHDGFDEEFFERNIHLKNMCNLMSLNMTPIGDDDSDYDDEALRRLLLFDNDLSDSTESEQSATPPSLWAGPEPTVNVYVDPWLTEDDRRRRSQDDLVYSGYYSPDLIFAESSEFYDHLKNRDNKMRNFCETELHDCGQPTERQEEHCIDEQFNHCICPIVRSYRRYQTIIFVVAFLIPLCIIIYCYSRFLYQICTISKSINTFGVTAAQSSHHREIRHLAILVMTLVAAFLICWTPVELIILVRLTGKMARLCEHSCRFLDKVSRSLVWLSSTVNAILYIHSGGFKSKIKKRARQYVSENPARTSMLHSQIHSTQRESLLDSVTGMNMDDRHNGGSKPSSVTNSPRPSHNGPKFIVTTHT